MSQYCGAEGAAAGMFADHLPPLPPAQARQPAQQELEAAAADPRRAAESYDYVLHDAFSGAHVSR